MTDYGVLVDRAARLMFETNGGRKVCAKLQSFGRGLEGDDSCSYVDSSALLFDPIVDFMRSTGVDWFSCACSDKAHDLRCLTLPLPAYRFYGTYCLSAIGKKLYYGPPRELSYFGLVDSENNHAVVAALKNLGLLTNAKDLKFFLDVQCVHDLKSVDTWMQELTNLKNAWVDK